MKGRYRAALVAAVLCTAITPIPSHAAQQVWLDGATFGFAVDDPYFTPVAGGNERHGMISFWYASTGQLNNGWVTIYQTQYVSDQRESSIEVRLVDSTSKWGFDCPDLRREADTWGWDSWMGPQPDHGYPDWHTVLDEWLSKECYQKPDNTMYNSGLNMGLVLKLTSDVEWSQYVWAKFNDALPMDGNEYNVQLYYSTGDPDGPGAWATLFVTQKWTDPAYTPQYYPAEFVTDGYGNGFDVPLEDMYWQFGAWANLPFGSDVTCYRGGLAEFFFFPSDVEIIPYASTRAAFITPWGTGNDLGVDGTRPFNIPAIVYLAGNDLTFTNNSADLASGVIIQEYEVRGYRNSDNPVVGDVLGGILYSDWQDPF